MTVGSPPPRRPGRPGIWASAKFPDVVNGYTWELYNLADDYSEANGFGKGGTGVLSVDGKEVATRTIPHTIPFVETIYETFDVGVDTRTGVDDNDYQPPFRFTGKIDKLTVKLVPLKAADEKLLQQKVQETKNKAQ
jgi:hypothetical protein